ncbi:hypothetical protein KR093_003409, partial [Drosophila rubida]
RSCSCLALVLVSISFYYLLEIYMFALSRASLEIVLFFQPPYKERIIEYDVGTRNHTRDNRTVAQQLVLNVRVHCLLHCTNGHERRKLPHILSTWGARCNRMHIVEDGQTIQAMYQSVYEQHYRELDWLLHVNVDSYVIMENLRYHLAQYAPTEQIYLEAFHAAYRYAHVSLKDTTDYALSRGALEQLLARNCFSRSSWQDCLADMTEGPSELLFPFQVPSEVLPFTLRSDFWNWPYIYRAVYTDAVIRSLVIVIERLANLLFSQGFGKPLAYPIAFPYATANQLHIIEYILYHLRSYGRVNGMPAIPEGSAVQVPAVVADDSVARRLYKEVRILCLVLTYPHIYEKVGKTIQQTWGRRCNKLIIFSSRNQTNVDGVHSVALNVSEGYRLLWGKTKAAFRHVYKHHSHEADWFFKADHDTYAIMDNMRYMLHPYQPDEPFYFGCHFTPDKHESYMSGGAGYVLSREALRRLVEHGFHSNGCNRRPTGTEDFEMGFCLDYCGVPATDSRDSEGHHRFLPLSLEHVMIPGQYDAKFWLNSFMHHQIKTGMECCSTYAITIHYVVYYQMYLFDYLLYDMTPYGIIEGHEP